MNTNFGGWMKKLGKRGIVIAMICILLVGGMSGVYAAFSETINENIFGIKSGETPENTIVAPETDNLEAQRKKELHTQAETIALDTTVEAKLSAAPNKNLENGYKYMLAEKNLPETQRLQLEEILLSCSDPQAALVLFDYLHDNFFTFADLEAAVARYENGESLENILQGFVDVELGFSAREYAEGEIAALINDKGLSIDYLRIAEIVDAHGTATFDDVILRLSESGSWEDAAEGLGLLNVIGMIQSVTLNEEDIDECAKVLGINKEQAVKKLSMMRKMGMSEAESKDYIKSGQSPSKAAVDGTKRKLEK